MWKRGLWAAMILMEAATGEGGGAGAGAGTGAPAGTTPPAAGGTPAATGAGGEQSVLAGGAGTPSYDFLPEKYRATKDDGTIDVDASAKRLAEAHAALESRLGSGDVRPKTAEEYVVTVPDALKEAFDPKTDPGLQAFVKGAHEAGLSQKQMDYVMAQYFERAPELAAGAFAADAATTKAELQKTWTTPQAMEENVALAYQAAGVAAQKAGIPVASIMDGPLGNSPEFIKLMAALGPEFQEDKGAGPDAQTSAEDIQSLMASDAYTNPKHADHVKVSETVRRYYQKTVGTAPVT